MVITKIMKLKDAESVFLKKKKEYDIYKGSFPSDIEERIKAVKDLPSQPNAIIIPKSTGDMLFFDSKQEMVGYGIRYGDGALALNEKYFPLDAINNYCDNTEVIENILSAQSLSHAEW